MEDATPGASYDIVLMFGETEVAIANAVAEEGSEFDFELDSSDDSDS